MNRRKEGGIYESLAADYLEQQGYQVLARNYHNRFGELDLIAIGHKEELGAASDSEIPRLRGRARKTGKGSFLFPPDCFLLVCEVKYKRTVEYGDPLEAVTPWKIRHICRTTMGFYMEHALSEDFPCRFDVISFGDTGQMHIKDAFPFTL